MKPAKRTFAIVIMTTTLVSCSSRPLPAATPTMVNDPPPVYATTATAPLLHDLLTIYTESPVPINRPTSNYHGQLDLLYRGDIPYFITNHLPVDTPLWAAPIGQDGLAVIVSPDVDVQNLTLDQLRAIYQGHVVSWGEVGGDDQPIAVFSREDGSGTRAEFERMVMGFRGLSRNARIAASSELMIQNIQRQSGAIGYISAGYLNDRLPAIEIEGIALTRQSISESIYPLRSTLYIAGLSEPQGITRQFIAWIQTQEGQSVVGTRYVPLFGDTCQMGAVCIRDGDETSTR